jgi:ABC-type multidrug transport system fused ATPase/permease subunit
MRGVGVPTIVHRYPGRVAALSLAVAISVIPALGLVIVLAQAIRQLQSPATLLSWKDLLGEHAARWLLPYVRDTRIEHGIDPDLQILYLPIALAGIGLLHALFKAWIDRAVEELGECAARDARDRVMQSFFFRSYPNAAQTDGALLATLVGSEAREIKYGTRRILGLIPMNLLQSVVLLAWLVILDTKLFALFVGVLLPAGIVIRLLNKALKRLAQEGLRSQTEVLGLFVERLAGWETIRTFRTVTQEVLKFSRQNLQLYKSLRRSARARALGAPTVEWLGTVAAALVIILALRRLSVGTLSDSVLTGFLVTVGHLSGTLQSLTRHFNSVKRAEASCQRTDEFLRESLTPLSADLGLQDQGNWEQFAEPSSSPRAIIQEIQLNNVSVKRTHSGDEPAEDILVSGIQLHLKRGQFCAITGHSGLGKSTLLRCLLGLEAPATGDVFYNGTKISVTDEEAWAALSKDIVFIAQDPFMVTGTVADNVIFPAQAAAPLAQELQDRIRSCLDRAHLDKDIFTPVNALSGGERQRLMLARAFYKEATVWILDEATSALDARTEDAFLQLLQKNSKRHIVIFVTHRTSVVNYADTHINLAQYAGNRAAPESKR